MVKHCVLSGMRSSSSDLAVRRSKCVTLIHLIFGGFQPLGLLSKPALSYVLISVNTLTVTVLFFLSF